MNVDHKQFARALEHPDPMRRGEEAMQALNWPGRMAKIEWQNGKGYLGHLILESFPTGAAVFAVDHSLTSEDEDWKRAWLNGARWCLSLHRGFARWYDLQLGRQWSWKRSADAPLLGFTPDEFVRVGRFEPRVASGEFETGETEEHATAFLVSKLFDWWNDFLLDLGSPRAQGDSKELFAQMLSAILLLRTIEDLRVSRELTPGRLRDSAVAMQHGNEKPLRAVFEAAADKFQSLVLRRLPETYFPPRPLSRIILDTYDIEVDFADLNVDPVGHFYEQVLGADYQITEKPQASLFERNATVKRDTSARREGGVYYTPRVYADSLARRLVRPLMRAAEDISEVPVVADIACGSGELLCAAFREMIAEPRWRRPDTVKRILATKIHGIDLNATGKQLTALNLLRTAVRMVPELVVDHLPLPSMDDTLHQGNSLRRETLRRIPSVDVAILNPPFHGAKRWHYGVAERDLAVSLRRAPSRPNQAFAMLLAALDATHEGGRLGCVFPSQLMSGVESTTWRRLVSSQLSIEAVIENYGNPFPDVQSYAGLIWGRKRQSYMEPTRTRVIRVEGAARFQSSDMAAVFAGASRADGLAKQWIREPIEEGDAAWLELPKQQGRTHARTRKRARVPFHELTGGYKFHQAPVPAPRPWNRDLFFFRPVDGMPGCWEHVSSGIVVRGESSSLRPIGMPNHLLPRIPQFCEPSSEYRVFLPGDGSGAVSTSDLGEVDPVAVEILRVIRAVVQTTEPARIPRASKEFAELLRTERIAYCTRKQYVDLELPLLVASKATRSHVGKSQGLHWSCWINEDGTVVPLGGIYCRMPSTETAVATACWLNLPGRYLDIFETAARRNLGTRQPSLVQLSEWMVPAVSEPEFEDRVGAMMAAYREYRSFVAETSPRPVEVSKSTQYRELLKAADELWQ